MQTPNGVAAGNLVCFLRCIGGAKLYSCRVLTEFFTLFKVILDDLTLQVPRVLILVLCEVNANVYLSIYLQNPTVSVYTTNFLVGSSKQANLLIRDQTISAILCSIRLSQVFL